MAKNHGARQQKKVAKQKAKRSEKRSEQARRTSIDPSLRLQHADKWPVVEALVGKDLWEEGIGYLMIARQEAPGRLVFACYLVDVWCLGVKNAFWHAGGPETFKDLVRKTDQKQRMTPIAPACLVKIVKGAVDYAASFGFRPHPDFRHAAALLEGIDPASCPQDFTFGKDGKPFYFQGPHESAAQASAIAERIAGAGGHFVVTLAGQDVDEYDVLEDDGDLATPER